MSEPIDLDQFCCRHQSRLATPFQIGDWVYATDGKVCVRVPAADYQVPERSGQQPSADKLSAWDQFSDPLRKWAVLPPIPLPMFIICNECRGSGVVECNYEHEHDCPHCGNDGVDDDGNTLVRNLRTVTVSGDHFAAYYLRLALKLPSVRYSLWEAQADPVLLLQFAGGQGVLMGHSREVRDDA